MPTVNDIFVFLFCAMFVLLGIAAIGARLLIVWERIQEDWAPQKGTWRERLRGEFERRAGRISKANRWLGVSGIVLMAVSLLQWYLVPKQDPPATAEHLAVLGFTLGTLLVIPLSFSALWVSLGSFSTRGRNGRDS